MFIISFPKYMITLRRNFLQINDLKLFANALFSGTKFIVFKHKNIYYVNTFRKFDIQFLSFLSIQQNSIHITSHIYQHICNTIYWKICILPLHLVTAIHLDFDFSSLSEAWKCCFNYTQSKSINVTSIVA